MEVKWLKLLKKFNKELITGGALYTTPSKMIKYLLENFLQIVFNGV